MFKTFEKLLKSCDPKIWAKVCSTVQKQRAAAAQISAAGRQVWADWCPAHSAQTFWAVGASGPVRQQRPPRLAAWIRTLFYLIFSHDYLHTTYIKLPSLPSRYTQNDVCQTH